ncbi:hypothetical protein H9K76_18455 [Diaphorobacter ruginosibacter]|uniref:DUF1376 domain-containing protein n=1 Tax=Diaphorobacter ruginosibacter TaxID=1715720 RepID=A0A7G9RLM4_9BURK|nr:hypothetical protein [Diaphorobacter ruginosibacter]QNN56499.1 hypothetical protein H9K76_18455 [Diaphorobacter ruginosibacter]
MTAKTLPWLRLYTEIIDDEKLGLLAFEDRWHFVAILCLKGKGVLDSEPDAEMLQRKVALKMGVTLQELEKIVARLARMGLIDRETCQPCAWDTRQMQSDSSTERVKAYRERLKQARNVSTTVQDADTELEKEREEREEKKKQFARTSAPAFQLPEWINQAHWDAWHSCPKRKKATNAQKQMAIDKLSAWRAEGVDHAAALENAAIGGWQGLFKPDPSVSGSRSVRRSATEHKYAAAAAAIFDGVFE